MSQWAEFELLHPGWALAVRLVDRLLVYAVALVLVVCFPVTMLVLYLVQWWRGKI
jgi:hypothetical protein